MYFAICISEAISSSSSLEMFHQTEHTSTPSLTRSWDWSETLSTSSITLDWRESRSSSNWLERTSTSSASLEWSASSISSSSSLESTTSSEENWEWYWGETTSASTSFSSTTSLDWRERISTSSIKDNWEWYWGERTSTSSSSLDWSWVTLRLGSSSSLESSPSSKDSWEWYPDETTPASTSFSASSIVWDIYEYSPKPATSTSASRSFEDVDDLIMYLEKAFEQDHISRRKRRQTKSPSLQREKDQASFKDVEAHDQKRGRQEKKEFAITNDRA